MIVGENFNQFVLRLRQQMSKCLFGTTKLEIENICLIDKIIDEWAPLDLKRKLLEKEYGLDEIIQLCQVDEQIRKQSQSMEPKESLDIVHKIDVSKKFEVDKLDGCGRCGRKDHNGNSFNCPAKNQKCNKCNRFGHFARKCRTNLKRSHPQSKFVNVKRKRSDVRHVEDSENSTSTMEKESGCFKISSGHEINEKVSCHIGGQPIWL